MKGRYFIITEEEAEKAWGVEYKDYHEYPGGGYMVGYVKIPSL